MFSVKKNVTDYSTATMIAAYDALIGYNVRQLPVDVFTLLHNLKNVSLYSFDEFSLITDRSIKHLQKLFGIGVLIYSENKEKYCILYDSHLNGNDLRWFLSGCIAVARLQISDFALSDGAYYQNIHNNNSVMEFTYFFTAPDPILKECEILSSQDILKYCRIPFKYANKKHNHLKYRRNFKISYVIEDLVIKNFESFIRSFQ